MLWAIALYVALLFGISVAAQRRVNDIQDFLVAGRRLGTGLSSATLLATWFGAGTLLAASDEVYRRGLPPAALDPLGAGLCLVLAGVLLARPLRRSGCLTIADLFGTRYDGATERLAALLMVPGFLGWIAAQYVSLAAVLERLFGLDPFSGILLVALVGASYTVIGGMWSVTLTDALQMGLVVLGLVVLGYEALGAWQSATHAIPAKLLDPLPRGTLQQSFDLIALTAVGALGNLPGQDLAQRILAAKDEIVARRACFISATIYLALGGLSVALALSAHALMDPMRPASAVLVALAQKLLSGPMAMVFILALASAVLSSLDSAILAPASLLARNLLGPRWGDRHGLLISRLSVVGVALASLLLAYLGKSAYSLLEQAYVLPLVTLLVPLLFALYAAAPAPRSARASMVAGLVCWLSHAAMGWSHLLGPLGPLPIGIPISLGALLVSAITFWLVGPKSAR